MRGWSMVVLGGLMAVSTASAQAPARFFLWKAGQVLNYRFEQSITEQIEEGGSGKRDSQIKLNRVRRWQVLEVDAAGVATLQMSMPSMRFETRLNGGETLVYDSAAPDKSHPEMRQQLSEFVGKPLAVLRVDGQGRVIEVKETKVGTPNLFSNEPPFGVLFPGGQTGPSWEMVYDITLDPPHGTGEKYQAIQKTVFAGRNGLSTTLNVSTSLKTQPEPVADRIPLLRFLPEGQVIYDNQAGLVRSVRFKVEKELADFQGKGSKYIFRSTSVEEYIGNQ